MYDCLDGTSDDEELDCIGVTTSGTFNRPTDDPNQSTNQAQSLLTYENVILLIGTFLGFIGAILLGFLIAKRTVTQTCISSEIIMSHHYGCTRWKNAKNAQK